MPRGRRSSFDTEVSVERIHTSGAVFGAVAVTLFVVSEIFAAVAAAVWALSGYFGLGSMSSIVLSVILGVPGLYASVHIAWLAWQAETDPVNN